MLSDEASPWRSELYIDVSRPVPGAEMEALSGAFLTRVFDGPFKDAPRWAAETKAWAVARGRRVDKLYFGYTTCSAYAKAYGHNYVVMFAKVGPPPS